jgi:hypothetical protein
VFGGLLPRATANADNYHNSSKLNTRLCTLNFSTQGHRARANRKIVKTKKELEWERKGVVYSAS